MDKRADLHIHTTASDGTLSPSRVVEIAAEIGLAAVGITDHDAVAGIDEALAAGERCGVEVVPGIEISATHDDGAEVHVLGYFLDYHSQEIADYQAKLKESRVGRARKIVELLNRGGIPVSWDRVVELAQGGAVGRPHIARALVEIGAASSMDSAFGKYLLEKGRYYAPRFKIGPVESVELILRAGGVPICAHVAKLRKDELLPVLMKHGMKGIEVWHPDHTKAGSHFYEKFARDRGMIATGGSDAHGFDTSRTGSIGECTAPYEVVAELRAAKGSS